MGWVPLFICTLFGDLYMDSGIYKIYCNVSGKFYVGSSQELSRRKHHHYNRLRANKHGNPHLQNSYNLYGESNMTFEILEYCDKSLLLDVEQRYIDSYKATGMMFNVASIAGASMRNKRHSASTIHIMKQNHPRPWTGKHLSAEHKKKISEKRIELTKARGLRKLTDEQVREVRKLKAMGIGDRTIASKFNVSRGIIIAIRKGTRYTDVV
jgi:group I intron endonuclease